MAELCDDISKVAINRIQQTANIYNPRYHSVLVNCIVCNSDCTNNSHRKKVSLYYDWPFLRAKEKTNDCPIAILSLPTPPPPSTVFVEKCKFSIGFTSHMESCNRVMKWGRTSLIYPIFRVIIRVIFKSIISTAIVTAIVKIVWEFPSKPPLFYYLWSLSHSFFWLIASGPDWSEK